MHLPIPEVGRWLGSVVRGHFAYFAVPGNSGAIRAFVDQVTRHWLQVLRRRSQRAKVTWERMATAGYGNLTSRSGAYLSGRIPPGLLLSHVSGHG